LGKPYPNRRKKRPGRRPPHHYRGGYQIRPNSFQDFGAKHVYDWIFPEIHGRQRRKLFNGFSAWFTISMGGIGGALGWRMAGPLGAFLGFGGGFMLGDHLARQHRFYRP
jgi:hypothetical protein